MASRSGRMTLLVVRRWIATAAPKKGDAPLMTRRADRKLPNLSQIRPPTWRRTLPFFILTMALASAAIFNYQKTTSPVIAAALYALRTSPVARAHLGDDIYFAHAIPWISGELNTLRGRVDICFSVKGDRGKGVVRQSGMGK
ncbi:cytochrome oxidase assembly [Ophiocordyceps camponoti-floridani]|uniref:Cytochrome oxidase assembly n=1 Tax=Ophiocordyceps camponoti-floridani TaxID=2030778 RepID=A0A8H4VHF0_9HYPO|nr:cytochrome oxidase assembly [Ophiocordyceps camponoti-floridani]